MPRTTAGRIFGAVIVLAIAACVGLVRHYNDSYSIKITTPNESWLHDLPWHYEGLHGASAAHLDDSVFFSRGEAEVVVMTRSVPPFASASREPFERGFVEAIHDRSGARPALCTTVTTEGGSWSCIEWTVLVEGTRVRHRAYLSGRGVTKAIVMLTAPAARYSVFGDPRRWLETLHWEGPSVLEAI